MRLLLLPLAALTAFALGCNRSPEGGKPGTDSTFTIALPSIAKDIKQGTAETVEGSIKPDSAFKKDVKLTVAAPEKVHVKLDKDTIKASDGDKKFNMVVTVEKDAAIAEHEISVTGTPEGGGTPTTGKFKIKVTAP